MPWAEARPPGASSPPDQLEPGRDVAPLVGAAHLQLDAVLAVEGAEVGGLERHVAELGEREAALEPDLDRVLGEHVRDREVLADVAQVVDQRPLPSQSSLSPSALRRAGREVQEALQLAASRHVADERLASRLRSMSAPTGADHPVPPPTRRAACRAAGAGPARRSGSGGRCGASRPSDRSRCRRRSAPVRQRAAPEARRGPRGGSAPAQLGRAGPPGRSAVALDVIGASLRRRRPSRVRPGASIGRPSACMVSFRPQCKPASPGGSALAECGRRRPRGRRIEVRRGRLPLSSSCPARAGRGRTSVGRGLLVPREGPARSQGSAREDRLRPADRRVRPNGGRAGPLGSDRRTLVTFDQDPARARRRHDGHRGQDVLGELRLRPRWLLSPPSTRPRQRPRRLDDHPAARPRAPPALRAPSTARSTSARSRRSSSRSA